MKKLLLHNYHSDNGAEFYDIHNHLIPTDYGNIRSEVKAINSTLGLLDRSYLGKILVQGSDSLDLLNRISTNDLHQLTIGTVCDTIFVTPKGRLIDFCRIINLSENKYLLICSFLDTDHLMDWLNRFIILEDVELLDASDDYIWLTLLGPHYELFLNKYSSSNYSNTDEAIWIKFGDLQFPALKNTNFIVPSYNFCFPKNDAENIYKNFVSTLLELKGKLIGDTAFQVIRIESGMPDWGTEINTAYNPHEARLLNAVSFTKGCYTGQEVIARLDTYDKVQKYLMIVDIFERIYDDAPLNIYIDDEIIGKLTSYIVNPINGKYIGLGYIKKIYTTDDDIYVELQTKVKRVPAKLRKPPTAY